MTTKVERYIEAVGRRKTAVARVRITPGGKNEISVNGAPSHDYFKTRELRDVATSALAKSLLSDKFSVSALVTGGGVSSQAEAVRHGLSRALVKYSADVRHNLKKIGYLKRDPRKKERKKFGLKKARKSPQWSKR